MTNQGVSEDGTPHNNTVCITSGLRPVLLSSALAPCAPDLPFREEYIFDVEKAVVVETPQLGHATYVFAKPRSMDSFLSLYTKITKDDIRAKSQQRSRAPGLSGARDSRHQSKGVAQGSPAARGRGNRLRGDG